MMSEMLAFCDEFRNDVIFVVSMKRFPQVNEIPFMALRGYRVIARFLDRSKKTADFEVKMSETAENILGYCLLPVILIHVMIGFVLMIATCFLGIPDFFGFEPTIIVCFPLMVLGMFVWAYAFFCSVSFVRTGVFDFAPAPAPTFKLTFVGVIGRLATVVCGWMIVFGMLFLIPADRALMIAPLGFFGESAVPLATWFVDDSNPRVRRSAIDVLRQIGAPARPSAPQVAKHLDDADEQVRYTANSALRILNPELIPPKE